MGAHGGGPLLVLLHLRRGLFCADGDVGVSCPGLRGSPGGGLEDSPSAPLGVVVSVALQLPRPTLSRWRLASTSRWRCASTARSGIRQATRSTSWRSSRHTPRSASTVLLDDPSQLAIERRDALRAGLRRLLDPVGLELRRVTRSAGRPLRVSGWYARPRSMLGGRSNCAAVACRRGRGRPAVGRPGSGGRSAPGGSPAQERPVGARGPTPATTP